MVSNDCILLTGICNNSLLENSSCVKSSARWPVFLHISGVQVYHRNKHTDMLSSTSSSSLWRSTAPTETLHRPAVLFAMKPCCCPATLQMASQSINRDKVTTRAQRPEAQIAVDPCPAMKTERYALGSCVLHVLPAEATNASITSSCVAVLLVSGPYHASKQHGCLAGLQVQQHQQHRRRRCIGSCSNNCLPYFPHVHGERKAGQAARGARSAPPP
jgi:hypothetical protein